MPATKTLDPVEAEIEAAAAAQIAQHRAKKKQIEDEMAALDRTIAENDAIAKKEHAAKVKTAKKEFDAIRVNLTKAAKIDRDVVLAFQTDMADALASLREGVQIQGHVKQNQSEIRAAAIAAHQKYSDLIDTSALLDVADLLHSPDVDYDLTNQDGIKFGFWNRPARLSSEAQQLRHAINE